jgi:Tfp pilus assembly protein PilO
MSKSRIWIIGSLAAMIVIAVAGWSLGISPLLDQTSAANAQVSTIDSSNAASLSQLTSLKTQFANIGAQQASLDALRQSLPEDQGAAEFLQELTALSAAHNVTLASVTVASATVYVAPVSTDTAAATATAGSTDTSTPAPTPTASSAPATTTTPVAATATAGPAFVLVPVNISVTGALNDVRDFIGAVQAGTRLYFAASVALSVDPGTGLTAGNLTGDIFTLQGTSDVAPTAAASTTATPTPTPTPTPTATSKSTSTPTPTATPTSSATPKP